MEISHLIVGGGTAGCVVASRLSEDANNRVVLVEAGADYAPDAVPEDIAAAYAGRALYNRGYFWPDMKVRRGNGHADDEIGYEQARVIGGGSSINGQVALRGAPTDYDRWEAMGAEGWGWNAVLPYFRKLETDLDFGGQNHGAHGPIAIRRIPEGEWDGFTKSVVAAWAEAGFPRRDDMNDGLEVGYASVPVSHDGRQRVSAVLGYLNDAVRRRSNLEIKTNAEVLCLVFEGRRCVGVELRRGGESTILRARQVILCAGSLRTPWLMMKSGVGPAAHLREHGINPIADRCGVGQELQDHPTVSIVAFKARDVRHKAIRHNYANLVYSSGLPNTPSGDMVMSVICKTAWHALGDRLGALSTYVGKPFSVGSVRLSSKGPDADPLVTFNWLSDDRDVERAALSFRMMAGLLRSERFRDVVLDSFASGFSPRVKKVGALTTANRLLTLAAGTAMDISAPLRRQIIRRVAMDGPPVEALLADAALLKDYLRATVTGIWHPCGTARMGRASDKAAVVDPQGRVIGVDNLSVADASVMPEIPTTNLNIPTIMIAERIADAIRQEERRAA